MLYTSIKIEEVNMNSKDKSFIEELFMERDINKVLEIFKKKSNKYDKCVIIYFDICHNDSYEQFKGFSVNDFSVYGIANYENAFLLDKTQCEGLQRTVKAGRVINLDLNIIQYLNKIVNNRKVDNEDEFIQYLAKIKEYKMTPNISTALIERITTIYDNTSVFDEQILSYVKFETLSKITKENLQENMALPEFKYQWADRMSKTVKDYKSTIIYPEVIAIQALIMKSFLLKVNKNLSKKEKVKELIKFSLMDLNIFMENELFLCSLYLNEDPKIKRTFEKIESFSKDTIKRINNISWDLAHIRLTEKQMKDDLKNGEIIFHYFGTYDVGLKNIININPVIIMGLLDEEPIIVRKYSIESIDLFDENMLNYYTNILEKRSKEKTTKEQTEQIHLTVKEEINQLQNEYFNK